MITKAVIPAAGFGTRFLPATKAVPKEMIAVVDKPVIQYVVEEAVASGITDILIITSRGKGAIENHFDASPELEEVLENKNSALAASIKEISKLVRISYVRQPNMAGLGDALRYAKTFTGIDPFLMMMGDTIISGSEPGCNHLIRAYEETGKAVISVERIAPEFANRYGIVSGTVEDETTPFRVSAIVEKPALGTAPSNLAVASRYLLTPAIYDCIARTPIGKGGELQLTDAIQLLLLEHDVYGSISPCARYDIGDKLEFLKTSVLFGLQREDIGVAFRQYLIDLLLVNKS